MAFILGAVIGAGASLIGGAMASSAAERASSAQASASDRAAQLQKETADKAIALQKEMYLKNLELNAPFREAGLTAQNRLLDYLGLSKNTSAPGYGSATGNFTLDKFKADPGYAFRLSEGLKGLNANAAVRGGLISGNAIKAATAYGQELGSQEYQNAFNRYYKERENMLTPLQSLTGTSQTVSSTLGSSGQNYAGDVSNTLSNYATRAGANYENAGAARASGYLGGANAWNQALGGATNALTRGMTNAYMYGSGASPYSYGAGGYTGYGPFMGG
jgi:hypothetical protein